jgi:hypothetical protein
VDLGEDRWESIASDDRENRVADLLPRGLIHVDCPG